MMNKQKRENLAVHISERTGEHFDVKNIKTLGNWVLIKEKNWDDDWECAVYDASQGMSWECWTVIPMIKTPFWTKNSKILEHTLNELNKSYSAYLKEIKRDDLLEFFQSV
jgi:hypothetical protein|tara:strand:- start:47 stop:376 length:330 start_codon:yes stop_codon:yes gene_type:complete